MKMIIATAAALSLLSSAALAQGTMKYYVVHDAKTKKCTVVNVKPTAAEATIVGDEGAGTVYNTEADAMTGMKKVAVCM